MIVIVIKNLLKGYKKVMSQLKSNGKEIFVCVTSRNQRVYMQGVKNKNGEWIGFIERFELNLQI